MKFSKLAILTLLLVAFSFIACDNDNCIQGEGRIETRTIELSSFDKVNLIGIDHLTITQGETQEVKVTGYPNIIDQLNTSVSNQEWAKREGMIAFAAALRQQAGIAPSGLDSDIDPNMKLA